MVDFKQIKPSVTGHSIVRTHLTTQAPEYYAPGNDGDILKTKTITGVNNVLWVAPPQYLQQNVESNGSTLVGADLLNVDTAGVAGLFWSYPTEMTLTLLYPAFIRFELWANSSVFNIDFTNAATPGIRWDLNPIIDGGVITAENRITNQILFRTDTAPAVDTRSTTSKVGFDYLTALSAGVHTFGYRYQIAAPGVLPGVAGNPFRHSLTKIKMFIQEEL